MLNIVGRPLLLVFYLILLSACLKTCGYFFCPSCCHILGELRSTPEFKEPQKSKTYPNRGTRLKKCLLLSVVHGTRVVSITAICVEPFAGLVLGPVANDTRASREAPT